MTKKAISINLITLVLFTFNTYSQNAIKPPKGYSTQIGNMISMLDDLKGRVTRSVSDMTIEETDFLLDEKANRIGAMIFHLAATEKYYQVYTFENRSFSKDESEKWEIALSLGDGARRVIHGKPIKYYLDLWDDVRKETKKLLKSKDDDWFNAQIKNSSMTNHYAWYHVMEHQANHMGQIRLIQKRIK